MIEVKGKGGISAKVVAHSKSSVDGKEIITFELEYMRFIHSEFMTHRLLSRNAASSRAIPVAKMLELVKNNPAMPIHWGKNKAGMQAEDEWNVKVFAYPMDTNCLADCDYVSREEAWKNACNNAVVAASYFNDAGYHKQIVNRLLEPFQMIKVVCTATEWDNFFYLRYHKDAQPEIAELARCMWEAREQSIPMTLSPGQWHLPYVGVSYDAKGVKSIEDIIRKRIEAGNLDNLSSYDTIIESVGGLENALKISASCCAQVSYRKQDGSLEKAEDIYDKLINSKPCHASPVEHQATPMQTNWADIPETWEKGITHCGREGDFWSGNFKSWIQHRQLIDGHACWRFDNDTHS